MIARKVGSEDAVRCDVGLGEGDASRCQNVALGVAFNPCCCKAGEQYRMGASEREMVSGGSPWGSKVGLAVEEMKRKGNLDNTGKEVRGAWRKIKAKRWSKRSGVRVAGNERKSPDYLLWRARRGQPWSEEDARKGITLEVNESLTRLEMLKFERETRCGVNSGWRQTAKGGIVVCRWWFGSSSRGEESW
jgi:hypothetical protein